MLKQLTIFCFFISSALQAQQNLVPNGSFEECNICHRYQFGFDSLDYSQPSMPLIAYIPWIKNWFRAKGSPDWFNYNNIDNNIAGCKGHGGHTPPDNGYGYQLPRTDSSYMGLVTYCCGYPNWPGIDENVWREWAGVKLIEPLKSGVCYEFTMYVSPAEKMNKRVSSIGAYFTTDSIWERQLAPINIPVPFDSNLVQINHNPSDPIYDTLNWIPVTGVLRASGGERFLYLGNFLIDGQYPVVNVHNYEPEQMCYYSYFFIDDVSLYELKEPCAVGIKESPAEQITFFPNPASNTLTISTGNLQNAQVELFDISGRKLFQQNLTANQQSIDVSGYVNGIYICAVTVNGKVVRREKVLISR